MTFLKIWIGYAIFGTTLFSAFFVWAVRQRQFTDMESARTIALDAGKRMEDEPKTPGTADWTGVAVVMIVSLAVIVGVMLVAWKCARG